MGERWETLPASLALLFPNHVKLALTLHSMGSTLSSQTRPNGHNTGRSTHGSPLQDIELTFPLPTVTSDTVRVGQLSRSASPIASVPVPLSPSGQSASPNASTHTTTHPLSTPTAGTVRVGFISRSTPSLYHSSPTGPSASHHLYPCYHPYLARHRRHLDRHQCPSLHPMRRQLALGESCGNCWVTGNRRPAARPSKGRRTYVIYDDLKVVRLEPAAAHVSIVSY